MKIWWINHYALPPITAGGTRHYYFARQLIKRGHEVTLVASNYNHFTHQYVPTSVKPGQKDQAYEVPFIWIPTRTYRGNTIARFYNMLEFSYRLLRKKYLSRVEKPDLIIGSSPHLFAAFSAERLARRLNVPFVLEVRDIWPDTLVDLGRFTQRHPLIKIMKSIERKLYQRAKRVICLLPSADTYLIENGVDKNNILWLPNAIDADSVPQTQNSNTEKFTVMYAGSHGIANNLDTILDAAKLLRDQGYADKIHLQLVGNGPEKPRLQARANAENIHNISFLPPVAKKDIYHTLAQANVFIMLLKDSPVFRWGISPNKLFDYLIMQRPVIYGVETPFNPIEQHNAGLSVPPGNPSALAQAILKLYAYPKETLAAMGERGKNYVLRQHSVGHLTDKLENLLLGTMNN
jgi:glycosyltransferase involved in cell wall biosynthesis